MIRLQAEDLVLKGQSKTLLLQKRSHRAEKGHDVVARNAGGEKTIQG